MKKNIILLSGGDTYSIEQEVIRWIKVFSEKYSEMNIERINLNQIKENAGSIKQKLLSGWLFAQKQLFILSGGNEKRDKITDFWSFFESIFTDISDDHFLVFHWLTERATELERIIQKIWDIKKFDNTYNSTLWHQRFQKLDIRTITRVLQHYKYNDDLLEVWEKNTSISHSIAWTLTSLELLSMTQAITDDDRESIMGNNSVAKNYDLIDAIMEKDIKKSLNLFRKISSSKSMFEFLPGFIWLLRNATYIKYLNHHRLPLSHIKVHTYVMKKTLPSRISYHEILKLYEDMIQTSIAYKSGKLTKDIELWIILKIELGIMWLKK